MVYIGDAGGAIREVVVVDGLFRVRDGESGIRLAAGPVETGPDRLLPRGPDRRGRPPRRRRRTRARRVVGRRGGAGRERLVGRGPGPVDHQEVWAAGVTYRRSRDARKDESTVADVYDRVYVAERPELFFKAAGWRVSGPGDPVGIRADSTWDVPEPELGIVVAADGSIAGWVIGNDMSSRSIEGENPLYLPAGQGLRALVCARSVPRAARRDRVPGSASTSGSSAMARLAFDGSTSTDEIVRSFEDLVAALVRALPFPDGAILLTGTGVVPGADFTLPPGDVVEIRIDGLGRLRNQVIAVG